MVVKHRGDKCIVPGFTAIRLHIHVAHHAMRVFIHASHGLEHLFHLGDFSFLILDDILYSLPDIIVLGGLQNIRGHIHDSLMMADHA